VLSWNAAVRIAHQGRAKIASRLFCGNSSAVTILDTRQKRLAPVRAGKSQEYFSQLCVHSGAADGSVSIRRLWWRKQQGRFAIHGRSPNGREHPEKIKAYDLKYRRTHRAECIARAKDWASRNPDRVKSARRERYYKNREHFLAVPAEYRRKNSNKSMRVAGRSRKCGAQASGYSGLIAQLQPKRKRAAYGFTFC
jgi:hypothetical protein